VVSQTFKYDRKFIESQIADQDKQRMIIELQKTAYANKNNAAQQTDERAHLLKQMFFEF